MDCLSVNFVKRVYAYKQIFCFTAVSVDKYKRRYCVAPKGLTGSGLSAVSIGAGTELLKISLK
jgi:hypothetical protein